jgi:hypothetical protein
MTSSRISHVRILNYLSMLNKSVADVLLSAVFVTAAGFASASALYKLDDPPFVFDDYTIAPFSVLRYSP